MKPVLVIFFAIVAMISSGCSAYESGDDPFNPETQKFLIQWTAHQMHIKNRECIPRLVTLRAEQVSDNEFNKMAGFNTRRGRFNLFYPPNTILLTIDNENHNFVHETAHLIQYNCQNQRDGTLDFLEQNAVDVQLTYQNLTN